MLILVSGGSASGKSRYAEELVVRTQAGERIYVATMQVWDAESRKRVERPVRLGEMPVPEGAVVLLEDLSNLAANEWFDGGDRAGVPERVLTGIRKLRDRSSTVVVVTNELFSDGVCYDPETAAYLACLAQLNRVIAAQADRVYEVVCGIPVCWKGE